MHPRSILAIARKDALDILLNKTTLSLLLTPIVLALLFLLIANLLGSHTTNALIYDPGKSSVEQVLKSAYSDLKITYANSPGDVAAAFGPDGSHKTTSYALGLAVPPRSVANLRRCRAARPHTPIPKLGTLHQTKQTTPALPSPP